MSKNAVAAVLILASASTIRAANDPARFVSGKDWQLVGQGFQLTADSAVGKDGRIYFTDARNNRIHKIDPGGKITLWKDGSGGAHGIASGPDGRLYAGQHDRKRIVMIDRDGKESIAAEGVQTHHLAIAKQGDIYFADAPNHTIWLLDAGRGKRAATTAVNWPHGLRISPDGSHLLVTDSHTTGVWSFRIEGDGSLSNGQSSYRRLESNGATEIDAGGMTFDTEGFLYVGTSLGVQVFNPAGQLAAIVPGPGEGDAHDVFFGGADLKWLYVTAIDKIYRRPSKHRGAGFWTASKSK